MHPFILFLLLLSISNFAKAQSDTIYIMDPSFEDISNDNEAYYWTDCGDSTEQSFPIFKNGDGQFSVSEKSFEGDYFIGLMVREDGTTKGISQYLHKPLTAGKIYQFSVLLRLPSVFENQETDFFNPVVFEVYGSMDACSQDKLLAFSTPVTEQKWMQFDFILEPTDDFDWLTLRVGFMDNMEPYNGSVLIDYVSDIIEIE